MSKKEKVTLFYLGNGIILQMPRMSMSTEVMSAFILLGGLIYHGMVEVYDNDGKEKFKEMMESCFDYIKKSDFSQLAEEVKTVIDVDSGVNKA